MTTRTSLARRSMVIAAASFHLTLLASTVTVLADNKGDPGDAYVIMSDGTIQQYNGITGASVGTFVNEAINAARDLAFGPNGNLFVINMGSDTLEEYDGNTGALIGTFIDGIATGESLLFTPSGTLLVSHLDTASIEEYDDTTGEWIRTFATEIEPLQNSIVLGPNGNIFVGDYNNNGIHEYQLDGTYLGLFADGTDLFESPQGIAFGGPQENLLVASWLNSRVFEFDGTTGEYLGIFAEARGCPDGLRFAPNGNLFVSLTCSDDMRIYTGTGQLVTYIDEAVDGPRGITFKPGTPQTCLSLDVSTLFEGQDATWDVCGADIAAEVTVAFGFAPGRTILIDFAGYCADFGIQSINSKRLVCRKKADTTGCISCTRTLQKKTRGLRVLSQAAQKNTCPDPCMSNPDLQLVN